MKIAFLGWGSLIWDPRELKVKGWWKKDGPFLPIEYARISKDGRLTLVIHPKVKRVRTLWTYSSYNNIHKAIRNLRMREGIKLKHISRIGHVSIYNDNINNHAAYCVAGLVKKWAIRKGIGTVIWTDLQENFMSKLDVDFSENAAIDYLRGLTKDEKERARQYIQETPWQIVTHLRTRIKRGVGW